MDNFQTVLYVIGFVLYLIYQVFTAVKKSKQAEETTPETGQNRPSDRPASLEELMRGLGMEVPEQMKKQQELAKQQAQTKPTSQGLEPKKQVLAQKEMHMKSKELHTQKEVKHYQKQADIQKERKSVQKEAHLTEQKYTARNFKEEEALSLENESKGIFESTASSRFAEFEITRKKPHPYIEELKRNPANLKKALVYSEIFNTKF